MEEKASDTFMGRIGLMYREEYCEDWPQGEHNVDSSWLVDRSLWDRSFATEGVLACLRWRELKSLGSSASWP